MGQIPFRAHSRGKAASQKSSRCNQGWKWFCPFGKASFPHEKGSTVQSLYTCLFSLLHTIPEQQKAIAFAGPTLICCTYTGPRPHPLLLLLSNIHQTRQDTAFNTSGSPSESVGTHSSTVWWSMTIYAQLVNVAFLKPTTGLCVPVPVWPVCFPRWFLTCVKTHTFWREIQALYCLMYAMLLGFNGEVSGSRFGRWGTLCAAGSMNQPQQTCFCV